MSCAVIGDPTLSIPTAKLRAEYLGVSLAIHATFHLRVLVRSAGDRRMVISTVPRAAHLLSSFEGHPHSYVIAVVGSGSELDAAGITQGDPFQFFGTNVPIGRPVDVIRTCIEANTFESFLPAYQALLYRIDKDQRNEVRARIFAFLSGALKRPPSTGVQRMDDLLAGPLCDRLRSAVIQSKKTPVEECAATFNVDVFEIRYIQSNTGISR